MSKKLPIIEIFGPVIQGEGSLAGLKTHFIRFGGCDYRCSWCDTMYAVLPELVKKNRTMMTPTEIVDHIRTLPKAPLITLSGGNPAMHNLTELLDYLQRGLVTFRIVLETQGSIIPKWLDRMDHVTVSPKPPSSGMSFDRASFEDFLGHCKTTTSVKIVVFTQQDYEFAKQVFEIAKPLLDMDDDALCLQVGTQLKESDNLYGLTFQRNRLLNDTKVLWETVCKDESLQDVRVLPQLHTLVYGQVRGV